MSKYTAYAQDNGVNVIPESDFRNLVRDTFNVITMVVGGTAGPYGSQIMRSYQNQSTTTKDGYNAFEALSFNDPYKKMVYLAIKKICERVNNTVGDGTTSCILLAERIFNKLDDTIKTPEEKRLLLKAFNNIEKYLMSPSTLEDQEYKRPLTYDTFERVVSVASNYDDELVSVLREAFDPKVDSETGVVTAIRNVIPEQMYDVTNSYETKITTMQLPGQYHVRIKTDPDIADNFSIVRPNVRIVLYDHAMTELDWQLLEKPSDVNDCLIILARDYTKGMLNNSYVKYANNCRALGQGINTFLFWMLGDVQNEFKDLGALLECDIHTLVNETPVKYEDCPQIDFQVFNKNCMCLHIPKSKSPTKYINKLIDEMNADLSNSIINHEKYMSRIKALKLDTNDTIITCTGTSSLEMSMMMDKIDDCIAIVNSAFKYGTSPNLLSFGYTKINDMPVDENNNIEEVVKNTILDSIKQIFRFIYISKYGTEEELYKHIDEKEVDMNVNGFYAMSLECGLSWDVVSELMLPYEEFPTSPQYDIEVIVAAISIVKYLITSRSFIFEPTVNTMNY